MHVLDYVKSFFVGFLFGNWPIKLIIVDISEAIKDIIKILTAYETSAQGARISLCKIIFAVP